VTSVLVDIRSTVKQNGAPILEFVEPVLSRDCIFL